MPFTKAQYTSLGTYRKNGHCVVTPVWFAESGDSFYVVSNNQAGKVKRLKNSNHCRVAPCTFTGNITGAWHETTAVLLDSAAEIKQAHSALKKKYGIQMLLLDTGAWLGGKIKQRSYIRIQKPSTENP
ncbi:MAG: PPOX class F420-dependent oxidoreductase [Pseudomonadales bacterium]|nr:PPOX class F420-dependent oxidoreductase [Pseudomonadales bacterium]